MTRVTEQAAKQQFWRAWLCRNLPEELAAQVSGVSERAGELTIFAHSAAWSARLRYALGELDRRLREEAPQLKSIAVRVRPHA